MKKLAQQIKEQIHRISVVTISVDQRRQREDDERRCNRHRNRNKQ